MNFKLFLKNLTPPLLWNLAKKMSVGKDFSQLQWLGNYASFEEACAKSSGYDEKNIVPHIVTAARMVRDGEALWERDSVCFHHEEYNMHLLAALFQVAASQNGHLHVLDFGGALGSTYMQHRKILSTIPQISWHIVEQDHLVALGKAEFSTSILHFHNTMEEAFAHSPINCVILSSVLQYLPNPHELLIKIHDYKAQSIYVGRTPVHDEEDKITIQYTPKEIYAASYPCWFFNKDSLLKIFLGEYHILPWTQDKGPTGFMDTFLIKKL